MRRAALRRLEGAPPTDAPLEAAQAQARARDSRTHCATPPLSSPPYLKLSAVGAADAATARRAPLLVAHEDDTGADARTGRRVVAVRGRCMTLRVCVCVCGGGA